MTEKFLVAGSRSLPLGPWSGEIQKNGGDWRYVIRGPRRFEGGKRPGPWIAEVNPYACPMGHATTAMNAIAALPEAAAVLSELVAAFPEIGTDDELNGGDAVERLGAIVPRAVTVLRRIRGEG